MPVRIGWGDAEQRFIYVQFVAYCTVDDLVEMQHTLATLTQNINVPPIVANFVDHRGPIPNILPYFSAMHQSAYQSASLLVLLGLSMYDRLRLRVPLMVQSWVRHQVVICDSLAQARAYIAPDVYHTEA
jgi:hypothetical protein